MSSTISSSHGVVIATAAMAVSGTVLLLALRLQKPQFHPQTLRSCLSSDEKRSERKKKKAKTAKRVRFAEDVVEPAGDSEVFRRRHAAAVPAAPPRGGRKVREMPANRLALYNGMLRDRVSHRVAYS